MNWRILASSDDLQRAVAESYKHPVALFKHSTRCSISSAAKDRMERHWNFSDAQLPAYYLDLIKHRDVSNEIAAVTGIQHESPQLIILKDGKPVYNASHMEVNPKYIPNNIL